MVTEGELDMAAIVEAAATCVLVGGVVLDAAAGHRRQCLDSGFSETAAEHMAVTFHVTLLRKFFGS